MCAFVNIKNEKQNHPEPPLSVLRIAGQILFGMVTGFAFALPFAFLFSTAFLSRWSITEGVVLMIFFVLVPLVVYGLGTAVGVFFVGSMGNQTGSFLATLGWGLLAVAVSLFFIFMWLLMYMIGLKQILLLAPILLISPIYATCGFNSTRMYKETRRVKKTQGSKFAILNS